MNRTPSHWDVAETFLALAFLAAMAFAGWHLGGHAWAG